MPLIAHSDHARLEFQTDNLSTVAQDKSHYHVQKLRKHSQIMIQLDRQSLFFELLSNEPMLEQSSFFAFS